MSYETIELTIRDAVATLTLNRPSRLNAMTVQMHGELRDAVAAVARSDARVLVLTGAGRGFCAGQDLADPGVAPGADIGALHRDTYAALVLALQALPFPVIAAVNGVAAGAGANLALGCDVVIAAASATFLEPFCKLGLVPDAGGTWWLPRLVGPARALGFTLLGEPLPAADAQAWGLIWRAVPDDRLVAEVAQLAARLASAPTLGLAKTKALIRASWQHSLEEQLDLESHAQGELGRSHDYQEGVQAFAEKRAPRFIGR